MLIRSPRMDAADDRALARARRVVIVTLLLGYAAFYLCRANFDAALPLLIEGYRRYGWNKVTLGAVSSTSVLFYAMGKLVFGVVGDALGGKRVMLVALAGSAFFTLCIGVTFSLEPNDATWPLVVFAALACASRFFQAGGWGGVVHVVSRWFPAEKHGAVMGAISTSYEVGNVMTLLFCAALLHLSSSWKLLYVVNPLVLLCVGGWIASSLKPVPPTRTLVAGEKPYREFEEKIHPPKNVPLREALPWLVKKPSLWVAVALSVLLTFVRTGMMTWLPTFLFEIAAKQGKDAGAVAAAKSAIFSVAGIVGALVVGKWSDRFGPGRRAPLMVGSLSLLTVALLLLAHAGIGNLGAAMAGVAACGLFLLGPYSLVGGAITLDVAGTTAASTCAGIVDGVGYFGATLSGIVIGAVAQRRGWGAAFDVVAAVAFAATLVSLAWWTLSRRAPA